MSAPVDVPRARWASSLGFILAAMGAAIGFGSISRFPMNVANNGGAAFLLLYAAIMIFVGIPMLVAEFSLGRDAQRNPVGAFSVLRGKARTKWRWAGVLFFLIGAYFLSWYSVVSGWVLRYIFASAGGAYFDAPTAYLTETVEGPDALLWHAATMILVTVIVVGQISKGIERLNLVLMPLLFVMIIGLTVYAATLDGGAAGYEFYLKPDFSRLNVSVFAAAVGQAFFSIGVGIGSMMVYASYVPREASLAKNATIISLSTLGFATLCGLMLFPMLASFGLLGTSAAGLDLIFGPLAQAFANLGSPIGPILGVLFFGATFFAAFTSAVSLCEPAIAYVVEEHGVDRRRAAILVCALIYILGVFASLSSTLLAFEAGAVTDMLVILGGLLIALYVGWWSPAAKSRERMDETQENRIWRLSWFFFPIVKYAMPVILGALLVFSFFGTPCALSGGGAAGGLFQQLFGVDVIGCDGQ